MQQETVQKVEEARPQALTQAIRGRMTLALVIVAGFLDVVDFSIVQVALPTIRTELVVSLTESQWIIGAYGLTLAGFLMLSGRAGDVYGQKKLFVFGNVPIGAVGAILSQKFLADNPGRSTERHLDLPGAVSLTGGLILFVYALTIASIDGFTSIDTLVPLGLSGLILAGFLAIENRSRAPLIPLSFLRRGNVLSANAMGLIFTSSAGGLTFLLTVFLQQILNFSAPAAGIAFLPPALIFFFVGGWGSSWLTNRIGMKPVLILSMALVTIGSALLIPITVAGGYFGILPGLIVWSLGASIGFVALSIAAVAGTQRGEEGLASGLINTSERIGFPLGLAVLLTIATITDPTPVGASGPSLASLLIGFQYAFLAATVLNGIGLLIALLIKNEKATNQY